MNYVKGKRRGYDDAKDESRQDKLILLNSIAGLHWKYTEAKRSISNFKNILVDAPCHLSMYASSLTDE